MKDDIRNEGLWEEIKRNRGFMKCPDFFSKMATSDQAKNLPNPPLCLKARSDIIELTADFDSLLTAPFYVDLLDNRRSQRSFETKTPMTQSQLAFILWSSQGIQQLRGDNTATLRPVPSGGARHSFETYFIVQNVQGLEPGLYHYLPLENIGEKRVSIEFIKNIEDSKSVITEMLAGQKWASSAPVVVFLSCVAYRAEWRYSHMAHRVMLIDLGHVGQNWMLSTTALGLGSCCFAAFDQKICDEVLSLDGFEEYTVYACSIGKIKEE